MDRFPITPRRGWETIVEQQGLTFYKTENSIYWNESAYYKLSMDEVDTLEAATEELHKMCLEAAQHIIDNNLFSLCRIPPAAVPAISQSWNSEPPSLYGRFDFAFDGAHPPKLLEYNADTPTALIEASAIQWYWLEDVFPSADQFNSIHDKLIDKWKDIKPSLKGDTLYFCCVDSPEDFMTVSYIRETAHQAGIDRTSFLYMEEIGWNENDLAFRDLEENDIRSIFKLYPWEWLLAEFEKETLATYQEIDWIEPIWKMLWSNKAILAILWELFPNHPNLLETYIDTPGALNKWAKKPLLSREGANVTIRSGYGDFRTSGEYGEEGYVYQALASVPDFRGNKPIIGSWYITGQGPAGIGIRESQTPVTDNLSRFVPHIIA